MKYKFAILLVMLLVILVDDEEEFLEIASMKLQGSGFETIKMKNGHEAVKKAEELQPALVLSDVYMAPGPSGWEVALELRRNPKTSHVKLAFFTSLREPWNEIPQADRAVVLAELGEITFFSKTEDVEKLGERVQRLIA